MRLTGGEIIVEYLIKEKVPYVLGIPGHGCLGLFDAFKGREDKIEVLQVRHEQSAVHLADVYYLVTGQPLAVYTSIGPGATNTVIGAATAYVDSTAVLIVTGDAHTYMFGKGVLQEIERSHDSDFPNILAPVVKRCWQVTDVKTLPGIMQRAFNQMMSGRRGPVHLSMPMDVQADSADVDIPEPQERKPTGTLSGDQSEIASAVELLKDAKRPVILAGGGVLSANASDELLVLAERIDAPVITTLQGKSAFPENHSLAGWLGGSKGTGLGNELARNADVLLAVGCRFADETTSSYRHKATFAIPPTKLIHVDIDENEIGKNYPCKIGIVGDAKSVLGSMVEILGGGVKERKRYRREIEKLRERWLKQMEEFQESDSVPMTISRMLKETREFLDKDAIVVTAAGNIQAQILQEFPFYEPKTLVTTGGFSTMGFTLPASMGAKLAKPDTQVIAMLGDGDFMMTMQELATAVQYDIPVVTMIANNVGWLSIRDLQIAAYGEDRTIAVDFVKQDGELYSPDFKTIAEAFGCHAQKIERPEEVKPALEEAFAHGGPAVIEVIVNREFPYSGGLVTGWWDVPVPTYLAKKRAEYEKARAEERL